MHYPALEKWNNHSKLLEVKVDFKFLGAVVAGSCVGAKVLQSTFFMLHSKLYFLF
jgi:hypothetical protein